VSKGKPYPECGYLGSDAAELSAFALSLRLLSKLRDDGHTEQCARLQVGANSECSCTRKARK